MRKANEGVFVNAEGRLALDDFCSVFSEGVGGVTNRSQLERLPAGSGISIMDDLGRVLPFWQ